MYCVHCGAKISDNAKFCSNCGSPVKVEETKIIEDVEIVEGISESVEAETPGNKVWDVFATIGFITGIVCLPLNLYYFAGGVLSTELIVFSILGLKSKVNHRKAVIGLVLHCISVGIMITLFSLLLVFLIML